MLTDYIPILVIFFALFLIVIIFYNGFISRRNAKLNAFAAIDVQLKKRWDLVPNLVETVKGYTEHEKDVLEAVIAARKAPMESHERFAHEGKVAAEVGRLLAVAEDYPEIKAQESYLLLQRNLTEIESQISAARRAYNAAVTAWNNGVETFPGVVFAKLFNFQRSEWFQVEISERANVDVKL